MILTILYWVGGAVTFFIVFKVCDYLWNKKFNKENKKVELERPEPIIIYKQNEQVAMTDQVPQKEDKRIVYNNYNF